MLTLKACSCGWKPAGDAYNGLANFPVSQPGVRNQNDRASCGFAILRRAPLKWLDRSLRARLSVLIRVNSISCVATHVLRNAYCVFQHSVNLSPRDKKRLCGGQQEPYRRLLLLPKHLPVGLAAIGIKAITLTLFPSGFQLRRSDVPVRTAFL